MLNDTANMNIFFPNITLFQTCNRERYTGLPNELNNLVPYPERKLSEKYNKKKQYFSLKS